MKLIKNQPHLFLLLAFLLVFLPNGLSVLFLIAPLIITYIKRKTNKTDFYFKYTVVKTVIYIIAMIVIFIFAEDFIMKSFPDQYFYLDTINEMASRLHTNIFFTDYSSVISLVNRAFNVLLGYLSFINNGSTPLLIRSFNFFLIFIISCMTVRMYKIVVVSPNSTLEKLIYIIIMFLPSLNIYGLLLLRDVFISSLVLSFFLFVIEKKHILVLFTIIAVYWTRRQLSYVLILGYIFYIVINFINYLVTTYSLTKKVKIGMYSTGTILLIIFGISFALLMPNESYFLNHFKLNKLGDILAFFVKSFYSIGFLFENDITVSRPILLLSRLMTPELFIIPLLFTFSLSKSFKSTNFNINKITLTVVFTMIIYTFGYYVFNRTTSRYFIPFYPILIVLSFVNLNINLDNYPKFSKISKFIR